MWTSADGRDIPITSLDDDYLRNILAQMVRQMEERKLQTIGSLMLVAMNMKDNVHRIRIQDKINKLENMDIAEYIKQEWMTTNFRRYVKWLHLCNELQRRQLTIDDDNNGWEKP